MMASGTRVSEGSKAAKAGRKLAGKHQKQWLQLGGIMGLERERREGCVHVGFTCLGMN